MLNNNKKAKLNACIHTTTFLIAFSFLIGINADEGVNIGALYECAHGLKGNVWVINEKKVMIQGFHYDGKAPAAWFHVQLRPAKAITSDKGFVTLPFPDDKCDRLTTVYNGDKITLILPRSIKDFHTIGVLCYQYCHNFGHVIVPENLDVPEAPMDQLTVKECPKAEYSSCSSVREGALHPNCKNPEPPAGSTPSSELTTIQTGPNQNTAQKLIGARFSCISIYFFFAHICIHYVGKRV